MPAPLGPFPLVALPVPLGEGMGTAAQIWDRRRKLGRVPELIREMIEARRADGVRPGEREARLRRVEPGGIDPDPARPVALYSHYSPAGRIDAMVLSQLAIYRALGFDIVFVTTSPRTDAADWRTLKQAVSLAIDRQNWGRDFGAWKDAMPALRRIWRAPRELLLVNDSVLGPLVPLDPLLATMRSVEAGLVGLTESQQGPAHLQSYFLLARGPAAVDELATFFDRLRLTESRWLTVRRGEYGLTRQFLMHGHAVLSLFPYPPVRDAVERAGGIEHDLPINPTHHGWRALVEEFGFPFLKRDLLLRNPNRVRGLDAWRDLVPKTAPVPLRMIEDHLASYRRS